LATDVPTRLAWAQAKERGHVKLQLKPKKKAPCDKGWLGVTQRVFSSFSFFFLAKLISPKCGFFLIQREYSCHNISHFVSFFKIFKLGEKKN
jgi:hypothetical protein